MRNELLSLLRVYLPEEKAIRLTAITMMTMAAEQKDNVLIVVDGRQNVTGKTTLTRKLNELGFKVVEQWERKHHKNPDKISENSFEIVIRLNKPVK